MFNRVRMAVALLDVTSTTTAVIRSTSQLSLGAKLSVDCNVVVSELAHLGVVDTDNLGLFVGAEAAAGDEVHDPEDDGGHDEGVGDAGGGVCELVAELDPVVVEPASGNGGDAVKGSDGRLSEEASADVADETTDGVSGEDIEAVIVVEDELELGRPIASSATKNTESDSSGSTDESRSRGDGDESGNGTRAETDDGPLALETPIPEHPGQSTDGSSQVGDDASLNGAQVGGEGATTVESEPSEPEHDRAENDVGGVVWLVCETLGSVAAALAEVKRDGESGSSGRDVHRGSASKVKSTHDEGPAVGVPGPAGDRVVNEGRPEEGEDQDGAETCPLSNSAHCDDGSDGGEHALVDAEHDRGDASAADRRGVENTLETKVLQIADVLVGTIRESERISPEEPLERNNSENDHRDPEHGCGVLPSEQTRVEETETWNHDPHEGCGCDDPRHVTQVVDDDGSIFEGGLDVVSSRIVCGVEHFPQHV